MPAGNRLEIAALRQLGVEVDVATSNSEAAAYANANTYSLAISDIARQPPQPSRDGLALPQVLNDLGLKIPIIYYVGRAQAPDTPGGHPVTDTPTELFAAIRAALGASI